MVLGLGDLFGVGCCIFDEGTVLLTITSEACEACEVAGADLTRSYLYNDLALWDSPFIDPETCRSGGVDLPIGPWARCASCFPSLKCRAYP